MTSPVIKQNYVGLLQEFCKKRKITMPVYIEESEHLLESFKCVCNLEEFSTDGTGSSKKMAKHTAAKAMFEKINDNNVSNHEEANCLIANPICKIVEYCSKEKKERPLFSDQPSEGDLFVVSCTMEGFQAIGKGTSKKIAKEISADLVAKHFNIYDYFKYTKQSEERRDVLKNSVTRLYELCQSKKLNITFQEDRINNVFVVSCSVGELNVQSAQNISKKQAKMEAASLILDLLNTSTPISSPSAESEHKKSSDENSLSNDEPLFKRKKLNIM